MKQKEKFRRLLEAKGWTKAELARQADVNVRSMTNVTSGISEPGVRMALQLARALGVSADWLFDDNADWPPVEAASVRLASDMELIEDLARRRDLVLRDAAALLRKLPRRRLKRLNQLAATKERTEAEDRELAEGVQDLVNATSVANRLTWFEPNSVYPPGRRIDQVYSLIFDLEALRDLYDRVEPSARFVEDAQATIDLGVSADGGPSMLPTDGSVPRHPGVAQLVSREYYADSGRDDQAEMLDFVPVLIVLGGAPPRRAGDGTYAECDVREFIRHETADREAFACNVHPHCEIPEVPGCSIVVCEPGREIGPGDLCAIPFTRDPRWVEVVTADDLLRKSPLFKSPRERRERGAKVFPIVKVFQRPQPVPFPWAHDSPTG